MTVVLSALYVPADRPDRFATAAASGADVVVVDLEDAVAAGRKDVAREALAALPALVGGAAAPLLQVRVNRRGSAWHDDDLAAVAALPQGVGVRLPKTESPDDVGAVQEALPGRDVHALLESAVAVERAYVIASAGVATVAVGEADLRSDLGLPTGTVGEAGLTWSRGRVVNAAAAAGLPAPLQSVFTDVADLEGLERSCREGRALGLGGRTAIHPRQLGTIRAVYGPSEAEVEQARRVVDSVASAAADGVGTVVLPDGTFLDAAMVRAARRVLACASGRRPPVA